MKRLETMWLRFIATLVGDASPLKSAVALAWGWTIAVGTKLVFDFIYFSRIYKGPVGPSLNTNTEVLLASVAAGFVAVFVGAFVAAAKAPIGWLRHAVATGLPFYLGAVGGIVVHWDVVPWWHYLAEGSAALVAGTIAGFLYQALERGRGNGAV